MGRFPVSAEAVFRTTLDHMLDAVERAPAVDDPFSHVYFEHLFPEDIYADMLATLPEPAAYATAAERHYSRGEVGGFVRSLFALTTGAVAGMDFRRQALWGGVAAALTAPELKRAVFAKLATDMTFRFGVPVGEVADLAGHARPTLYRETEGFEIAPHPDTRKKVVTMHLYLPADESQLELGTALYRRRLLALPFGPWRGRFTKVKQFRFAPNSGYAFVVNNTLSKRSWHGRERLPDGAGVRNTLLNTFYAQPREGYSGYLASGVTAASA